MLYHQHHTGGPEPSVKAGGSGKTSQPDNRSTDRIGAVLAYFAKKTLVDWKLPLAGHLKVDGPGYVVIAIALIVAVTVVIANGVGHHL